MVRLALALTSILTETGLVGHVRSAALSASALPKPLHLSVSSLSRLHVFLFIVQILREQLPLLS